MDTQPANLPRTDRPYLSLAAGILVGDRRPPRELALLDRSRPQAGAPHHDRARLYARAGTVGSGDESANPSGRQLKSAPAH
jgi:hypothetical protein